MRCSREDLERVEKRQYLLLAFNKKGHRDNILYGIGGSIYLSPALSWAYLTWRSGDSQGWREDADAGFMGGR